VAKLFDQQERHKAATREAQQRNDVLVNKLMERVLEQKTADVAATTDAPKLQRIPTDAPSLTGPPAKEEQEKLTQDQTLEQTQEAPHQAPVTAAPPLQETPVAAPPQQDAPVTAPPQTTVGTTPTTMQNQQPALIVSSMSPINREAREAQKRVAHEMFVTSKQSERGRSNTRRGNHWAFSNCTLCDKHASRRVA